MSRKESSPISLSGASIFSSSFSSSGNILYSRAGYFLRVCRYCDGFAFCLSRCSVMPLRATWVSYEWLLTRNEWNLCQFLPPLVTDTNDAIFKWGACCLVSVIRSNPDKLLDILWIQSMQDVEEVWAVWVAAFGQAIGKVGHQLGVLFEAAVDVDDAELVILRHLNELDITECQQLLVLGKDLSEEVLVQHAVWRDVELDYTNFVRQLQTTYVVRESISRSLPCIQSGQIAREVEIPY